MFFCLNIRHWNPDWILFFHHSSYVKKQISTPQRFHTEDHLMIHRHKHEMTLKFPSIKSDNMLSGEFAAASLQTDGTSAGFGGGERLVRFAGVFAAVTHWSRTRPSVIRKTLWLGCASCLPCKSYDMSQLSSAREHHLSTPQRRWCLPWDVSTSSSASLLRCFPLRHLRS